MLHPLDVMGKSRDSLDPIGGGPNGLVKPKPVRVSATRHGVIATNTSEPAGVAAGAFAWFAASISAPGLANLSDRAGCQYNGAGQYFSGATSLAA